MIGKRCEAGMILTQAVWVRGRGVPAWVGYLMSDIISLNTCIFFCGV
jgi:hypothetical protein